MYRRSRFIICLFLFNVLSAYSQITVSENALPSVGDTLKSVLDALPPSLDLGTTGGGNDWDFSALQGISSEMIVFDAASGASAASFPAANQRVSRTEGSESYLAVENGQQSLVGFAGLDPFNIGIETILKYVPPYLERIVPLNYGDENEASSSFNITVAAETLPPEVVAQLSNVQIDSLRLTVELDREMEVDAWGNLTVPTGTYEVIREKRINYVNAQLEILSYIGWINVTLLAAADFPALAPDTTVSYHFWSENVIEAIAVITVNDNDESEIQSATYFAGDMTVDIPFVRKDRKDLIAYPNPALDKVRFDFRNLPSDSYKLVIHNILGQELWSKSYYISGNHTAQVDISNLRKGTYLYSLVNEKDKTLATKRLMVIRP